MFARSKVIVQGITGTQGRLQTPLMQEFGTRIIAGVTPGKGGEQVSGVPVYATVKSALRNHKAQWSIILVPAAHAKTAALEALQSNLNIIWITEHVPVHDTLAVLQEAKKRNRIVIGPNSPGVAQPTARIKMGIMPNTVLLSGNVGVVSRSGTLAHELLHSLTTAGIGQDIVIGVGGDPLVGFRMIDALRRLQRRKTVKKILLIGEIGGTQEQEAAQYIAKHVSKPVIAFIAGVSAPRGKQMGHAGAIINKDNTAQQKIRELKKAGVTIATRLSHVVRMMR